MVSFDDLKNLFGSSTPDATGLPPLTPTEPDPQIARDYVAKKYGLDQRNALQDQIAQENQGPNYAAAIGALGAGLSGGNAAQAGQNILDQKRKSQETRLGDFDKNALFAEESDPNSPASQLARSLAVKLGGDPAKLTNMTASQFKQFSPTYEKMYKIDTDKQIADSDAAYKTNIAKIAGHEREVTRKEQLADKKDRQNEQDVQKLSKDVAGVQGLQSSLDDVEAALGGNKLEDYETKGGKLKISGKDVDLPGVSIPLLGRVSAYSTEARGLQNAADKVFNSVLKDRSGSAVTNPELERLKAEFSSGKFNTEPEMVAALQRFKNATYKELKNREAAYNPDVVSRYTEQGGRTSKTAPNLAGSSGPKAGSVEDGYRFKGGDPKDPANWEDTSNTQLAGSR